MHPVGSFPFPMCCLFSFFWFHLLCCVCSASEEFKPSYYFCVGIFNFPSQTQWMTLITILTACQYLFLQKVVSSSGTVWILLYPGNLLFWFVMSIFCISWNSRCLRTAGSSSSSYQGGRIIPLCSHGNFSLFFLTSKAPLPSFKVVFYSYSCYLFSCCF